MLWRGSGASAALGDARDHKEELAARKVLISPSKTRVDMNGNVTLRGGRMQHRWHWEIGKSQEEIDYIPIRDDRGECVATATL